jgi:3-deoxy-manno-octulosonate cytidylyltransferase (CMP-KDO synthetase)
VPKVIGIIPSRYASRRFPGKPLALLGGLPIVVRVFQQAQKSTILDDVLVATDDQRIAGEVVKHGGKAVITTGNFTCGTDRVAAVAKNIKADIVVNIQGDELILAPEIIDKVANCLIDNPKAVMSTACNPIKDMNEVNNPDVVKVVLAKDKRALYFSRSRIPWFDSRLNEVVPSSVPVYHHIGIYGFTSEFLQTFATLKQTPLEKAESLEQLRALENGYQIHCVITPYVFLGINSQEDLFEAEKMLEQLR